MAIVIEKTENYEIQVDKGGYIVTRLLDNIDYYFQGDDGLQLFHDVINQENKTDIEIDDYFSDYFYGR